MATMATIGVVDPATAAVTAAPCYDRSYYVNCIVLHYPLSPLNTSLI